MRLRLWIIGIVLLVLCGLVELGLRGVTSRAEDDADLIAPSDTATCLECHGESVNADHLQGSAHGRLQCQQCHKGVNQYPHPETAVLKPQCATCHGTIAASHAGSIHGKPGKGATALDCAACHGDSPHELAPLSRQTAAQREAVCARCHAGQAKALSGSIHAHGDKRPTCQSCHAQTPHGVTAAPPAASAQAAAACRACHVREARALAQSAHGPHGGKAGANCLTCHSGNPHGLTSLKAAAGTAQDAQCRSCHASQSSALAKSAHARARHQGAQMSCRSCHGANPHAVAASKKGKAPSDVSCRSCHADVAKKLVDSAHGKAGNKAGVDVSCFTCHGGNAHALAPSRHLTPLEKSARCEQCHPDSMQRIVQSAHGPTTVHPKDGHRINCLTCHSGSQHSVTPPAKVPPLQKAASCRECHEREARILADSVHGRAAAASGKPAPNCITCHAANPKDVTAISKMDRMQLEASCMKCHADLSEHLKDDVHARPDKVPGDHPVCLTCHGGVAHGIQPPKPLSRKEQVALCAECHRDTERLARYGVTADTVPAYEATLHGKAVMRLDNEEAATCMDCHGLHGVLPALDAKSPTHPRHAARICAKCHEGNTKDFAFPYASHFRLKVEESIVFPVQHFLIIALIGCAVLGGLGLAALSAYRCTGAGSRLAAGSRGEAWFNAASLMGALTAATALFTTLCMYLLDAPGWRLPTAAGALLLLFVLLAQVGRRLIFRRHRAEGHPPSDRLE